MILKDRENNNIAQMIGQAEANVLGNLRPTYGKDPDYLVHMLGIGEKYRD